MTPCQISTPCQKIMRIRHYHLYRHVTQNVFENTTKNIEKYCIMKTCCNTKNENGAKVHRVPCGSVACSSSTARKRDLSKPVRGTRAPHTSAQAVPMLKTAEKSTALEDLWSIKALGALRNPAYCVPNLQELNHANASKPTRTTAW